MTAFGRARAGSKYLDRRVVGVQVRRRQHVLGQGRHQGTEQLTRGPDPLHEGGAAQGHPRVGEDLALAVQGQMKAVLPGQHQGKEGSARKAALDRARGRRRLDDARALRAALLRADMAGHREGDRLDVQHLGLVRAAQILEFAAAIGARTLGRCNDVIDVFEMLGQLLAAHRLAFGDLGGFERGVGPFGFGHRGFELLERQG